MQNVHCKPVFNVHNPNELIVQNVVIKMFLQQWTLLLEELQHAFLDNIVIYKHAIKSISVFFVCV